jgi:glucose/arabinose dehydrogenase
MRNMTRSGDHGLTRRTLRRIAALTMAAAFLAAVAAPSAGAVAGPQIKLALRASGLSNPTFVTSARDGTGRLFIVEQTGKIRIYVNGVVLATPFLSIGSQVSKGYEQGLLGLAFHPNYKSNRKLYVNFTDVNGNTVIREYRASSTNKNVVATSTARTILKVGQPYANHNGGMLAFKGGFLYVGMGDGGSGGDPGDRAQNLNTRLGKMLRINPKDPDGAGPKKYSIPASNPFVGTTGAKGEIWSLGLRNPWRWSFDSSTGDLWIGDVGQCQYEEVDHHGDAKGDNFGWNKVEGTHVFDNSVDCNTSQPLCTVTCHTLPVAEYSHDPDGCAIVGGYVYRGSAYPAWVGHYIYGDYCTGKMWEMPVAGGLGSAVDVSPSTSLSLTSYGTDSAGELYAAEQGGSIYKLTLVGNP